jgi:predicted nucleic acid-binding protein
LRAVLNSSAIIALSFLKHLDKLRNLFEKTLVASAVYDELCVAGRGLMGATELSEAVREGAIEVKGVEDRTLVNALTESLSLGEAETIALTLKERTEFIVLDDRSARRRAENLGLNVIGTLRVLRMMFDNGLVDDGEFLISIEKLREVGFRISDKVVETLRKEL